MNLQEITDAVDAGKTVYWCHAGYQVVHDRANGRYCICFPSTGTMTPLSCKGRLAALEAEFFLAPELEQLEEGKPAVEWASDETLRRIRSTTKRYRLSVIISTNDSTIDTRVTDPLWSALDCDHEILESVSMPQLLPPVELPDLFAGEGEFKDFSSAMLGN